MLAFFTGWRLFALVAIGAAIAGGWLYLGHLNRTIERQAGVIATQAAQLDEAVRVNAANEAARLRAEAERQRAESVARNFRVTAAATRHRLDKITEEITRAQGPDPAVGPRIGSVLDELQRTRAAPPDGRDTGRAHPDPRRASVLRPGPGSAP